MALTLHVVSSPASDQDGQMSAVPDEPCLRDGSSRMMTRSQAWNLYVSHLLSTWNVRTYEFAAIVFTAAAYPDTLSATAIRGIIRTLASILLSSMVGRWVDHSPDRLRTLLATVTINRVTVIVCCLLWYLIVSSKSSTSPTEDAPLPLFQSLGSLSKGAIFTMILALGILENQSASGNMLSMERDWVPTGASPAGEEYDLTHLNSVMRRIDLVCKLAAPIFISAIISWTDTRFGVLAVAGVSASSWGLEVFCARRVWKENERLQVMKEGAREAESYSSSSGPRIGGARGVLQDYRDDLKSYLSSPVMIPSLSLAFLHLSALSYGATFVTFLLNAGFSLDLITLARAAGSIVEISSTVVTPIGVRFLGKAYHTNGAVRGPAPFLDEAGVALLDESATNGEVEGRIETGLERLGLWGISFQLVNLVPVVLALWTLSPSSTTTPSIFLPRFLWTSDHPAPIKALFLFTFLSISRLGLWIFDLTTQQLTQSMTPAHKRSSFTGVEYSFVGVFELLQHIATLALHRPENFKFLAVASLGAVTVSSVAYAGWATILLAITFTTVL